MTIKNVYDRVKDSGMQLKDVLESYDIIPNQYFVDFLNGVLDEENGNSLLISTINI